MQADLCVSFLGYRLYDSRSLSLLGCGTAYIVDFNFPEDARWNAERQAVEFGVEIGEYRGVVRVPRRAFQRLPLERPTSERCAEAYYLQRTRFESIAERKLRRRPD
jgi:hypothetical protein